MMAKSTTHRRQQPRGSTAVVLLIVAVCCSGLVAAATGRYNTDSSAGRMGAFNRRQILQADACPDYPTIAQLETNAGAAACAPGIPPNIEDTNAALNTTWLLICGTLVFIMQAGFAMLEAGSIRAKNAKNILLKNLMDPAIAAIIWWAVGFPFAFGERTSGGNGWIGSNNFFLSTLEYVEPTYAQARYPVQPRGGAITYDFWFFQWVFSATAATIVSGAVAERCRFVAYLIYVSFLTGFIYPVVVHWVWSGEGWLSAFWSPIAGCSGVCQNLLNGAVDFAGSGVVHMTGGVSAFVAAAWLGPRLGRFDSNGKVVDIPPHSLPLAALGVFLLWFGWYGFNPGSTLAVTDGFYYTAAKVAVTTTLAAAGGGLGTLFIMVIFYKHLDIAPIMNGILSGLVAICSGCAVVEPWAAVVIGFIAAIVYLLASALLKLLKIDDPLDASPVHGFNGAWGLWATGLFATKTNMEAVYGFTETSSGARYWGGFYHGGGSLLGVQIILMLAIIGWVGICANVLFGLLKVTGLFRISEEDEAVGLDISHHGGSAYEWQTKEKEGVEGEVEEEEEEEKEADENGAREEEPDVEAGEASEEEEE